MFDHSILQNLEKLPVSPSSMSGFDPNSSSFSCKGCPQKHAQLLTAIRSIQHLNLHCLFPLMPFLIIASLLTENLTHLHLMHETIMTTN